MQSAISPSFLAILFVTTAASAQTPAAPKSQWSDCKSSFLSCAIQYAEADYRRIHPEYEKEIGKAADFNMCLADSLNLQNTYVEWFRKNAPVLQKLDAAIDQGIRTANERLNTLKERTIGVNPVPGQSETIQLKLSDLIRHLKIYKARLSNVSKAQVADLQKMAEQPGFSPVRAAHSQVIVAMEAITNNLNASLKQSGATYSLVFEKGAVFSNLSLRMDIEVDGKALSFEFPILDESFERVSLTEQEKWNLIRKNKVQLDGYSVDARERFETMQQKLCLASCKASWIKVTRSENSVPYVTPSELGTAPASTAPAAKSKTWQEMPLANVNIGSIAVDRSGQVFLLGNDNMLYRIQGDQWVKTSISGHRVVSGADGTPFRINGSDLFAIDTQTRLFQANRYIQRAHFTADGMIYYTDGSYLYVSRPGFPDSKQIAQIPCNYGAMAAGPKNSFYCQNQGQDLYQMDAVTGEYKQLKNAPVPMDIGSTSDGTLYVLDKKGDIHKFNGSAWTAVLSSPDARFPLLNLAVNDRYLCASQFDGRVYCIDTP